MTDGSARLVGRFPGTNYYTLTTADDITELWQSPSPDIDPGVIWPNTEQSRLGRDIADAARRARTADSAFKAAQAFLPLARRIRGAEARRDHARLAAFNAAARARYGGNEAA